MDVLIVQWGNKRPEEVLITNLEKCKKITLWKKGSDLTIQEVLDNEKRLIDIVNDKDDLTIVEYKKYCDYFGVARSQQLYDCPLDFDDLKHGLKLIALDRNNLGKEWQAIRADAAEAYMAIEKRGILVSGIPKFPKYSMDVYSGRSKTTSFNIQGLGPGYEIEHPDIKNNIFVRFDWVAADMRMASYLSEDKELMGSYNTADPYAYIMDCLGDKIDRDQCKLALNRAVNSLNNNDLILKIFPKFGSWIQDQKRNLEKLGYARSIMGRRFYTDRTLKGDRRAFNGTLQGSVAHAMQNTVSRVTRSCGNIIITEQHDSLTIAISEPRLMKTIRKITEIMLNPIDGVTMPLTVEVGRSWGTYKRFKEFR